MTTRGGIWLPCVVGTIGFFFLRWLGGRIIYSPPKILPPLPYLHPVLPQSWLLSCDESSAPPVSLLGVAGAMGDPEYNSHLKDWWERGKGARLPLPTVALAFQGSASDAALVMQTYAGMPQAERALSTLFLLTYDAPIDCTPAAAAASNAGTLPLAVCLFAPGTTWTTGRNSLARAMFHAERARGALYKTWVFADADAGSSLVSASGDTTPSNAWGHLVRLLALPLRTPHLFFTEASVSDAPPRESPTHESTSCQSCLPFLPADCGDGLLVSFDREAVPLLLPYFPQLDAVSWWSSQGSLFHLQKGCLGGWGGLLPGFRVGSNAHASYPKGRPIEAELNTLRLAFPSLVEWPLGIAAPAPVGAVTAQFQPGNCAARNSSVFHWRSLDGAVAGDVKESAGWLTTPEMEACGRETVPRFCSFALNVSQPFSEAA